jgi:predicted phosphodiesterase
MDEKLKKLKVQQNIGDDKIYQELKKHYTDRELKIIAKGGKLLPGQGKMPIIDFSGRHIRFGYMTDPHIGSIYFVKEWWDEAIRQMKKEKCEFMCLSGDVTDGMKLGRHKQIYELIKIGYTQQKDYAIEQLKKWGKKMYVIDGNHDRWYVDSAGAIIVQEICEHVKDAEFLGHDEGDISLGGKARLRIWHGSDGDSYAFSYRLQKIIESFTGGDKPNMILCGHTHKSLYMPCYRNVQAISGGAMCKQSKWMRSTRKANHSGFWIIDLWINKTGITKCSPTWYSFYE